MDVGTDTVNEECPGCAEAAVHAPLLFDGPQQRFDLRALVQTRHLRGGEEAVDVLQHAFEDDLMVLQKQAHLAVLDTRDTQYLFDVGVKALFGVVERDIG